MAITKPPVLPSWAEAGDKIQPSNAEIQAGWPLSSIPPSRQRFNWLLNFLANGIRYFSRRGLADYDNAETYMIGDKVVAPNGKSYRCKIDNTVGVTPSADPAKWERWGFTLTELNSELATPAQFDNSTKAATTAFVRNELLGLGNAVYDAVFGKSLAVNGYQKLPGSMIIQWGTIAIGPGASGIVTLTFPLTFPVGALSITATDVSNEMNKSALGIAIVSNSQATISWYRVNGTTTQNAKWIAIGY